MIWRFPADCLISLSVIYEAGSAKNRPRGGSAGARSESRARGTGAVYGAYNAPCESVAGGGDGAFVAAALYALIRVHPLLYRYQTLVSEITFLLFLELINHQKFHTTVSSRHPKAPQPRRPTINRARFRTQCATGTNAWRCMVRKRRGTGEVMTMRCSSDEAHGSKMTRATRAAC